jgi:hypothetical protein
MLMCAFTHSRFIKNPPVGSWEANNWFFRGFCHINLVVWLIMLYKIVYNIVSVAKAYPKKIVVRS